MTDEECKLMEMVITELVTAQPPTEVAPPKADVVQSVVRPPDAAVEQGESGRSPDRHALTKVRSMVQGRLWATQRYSSLEMPRERAIEYFREILKYIEELDKGSAVATRQDDGE